MTDDAGRRQLQSGAAQLGVALNELQLRQLEQLLDELQQWSAAYNLTALTDRQQMLTHHLLDSLAAGPALRGTRIADVGTGAGFPGLPLAIARPELSFTLIDSTAKKIRFVAHAARSLGLANVTPLHARMEALPELRFDTVLARAVAALPVLVNSAGALCADEGCLVAMKGRYPADEVAALPAGWIVRESHAVDVPGLGAERHLLTLQRVRLAAA